MKANSKKNTELAIPSKESIKNNDYPINEDGQSYGLDMRNIISDSPDLILAEGKNGVIGYKSYNSKITSPDDLKEMLWPKRMNLFLYIYKMLEL